MSKTIGVMGCGWLGLPLATSLIGDRYKIHGSTTSQEKIALLKEKGIVPFQISLSEDTIVGAISKFLAHLEVLVLNIPPKLRGGGNENYIKKMRVLHEEIRRAGITKIIFISSTSVYGNSDDEVTEETIPIPATASGKQLLTAEKIFSEDKNLNTTVIRFGGLIGPNRHPITTLSGKKGLSNGNAPINLIHLNDCIRIITAVIKNSWWNEVLNGVYPEHPNKQEYYTKEAEKRSIQIPDYKLSSNRKGKIIHANRLNNVKKFIFKTTL